MGIIKVACDSDKRIAIRRKGVEGLIILISGEVASFNEHDFIVRSAEHIDKEELAKHRDKFLDKYSSKKRGNEYILY